MTSSLCPAYSRWVSKVLIDVLFSRYLFSLFVWQTSQTLLAPAVLLHMCKVQRSAWACVWAVGPSGIKPTSCLTDSNSLYVFLTPSHTSRLRLLSLRWMLLWMPCRVLGWAPPTTCRPTIRMPRACFSGFPGRQTSGTPSSSSFRFGSTCGLPWALSSSGWLWSETGLT